MSVLVALQSAGNTSTATWAQAPASWAASAAEEFAATTTWAQTAATWQATASEAYPSSATWVQASATWNAIATEAFSATASFAQATAAWSAAASEDFASSATWTQATAAWSATAELSGVDREFTGSWQQTASWDASATTATATCADGFQQDTFQPSAFQGCIAVVVGGGHPALRWVRPRRERLVMAATFVQKPAGWRADMTTIDDESWLLLFDEPALIGA